MFVAFDSASAESAICSPGKLIKYLGSVVVQSFRTLSPTSEERERERDGS